jgi:hypothetical protein
MSPVIEPHAHCLVPGSVATLGVAGFGARLKQALPAQQLSSTPAVSVSRSFLLPLCFTWPSVSLPKVPHWSNRNFITPTSRAAQPVYSTPAIPSHTGNRSDANALRSTPQTPPRSRPSPPSAFQSVHPQQPGPKPNVFARFASHHRHLGADGVEGVVHGPETEPWTLQGQNRPNLLKI